MDANNKLIEDRVSELKSLATRQPLRGYTLARAKELMGILREVGFTNKEISDLTRGAWSEPTVKLYSRGSEVKDSTLKQKALNLLSEFIDTGLSIGDIQYALSMKRDLDSKGLDIQGVSLFLGEAKRAGIDVKHLAILFQDLRGSLADASIDDLADTIRYKDELMRLGIGTPEVQNIVKASRNYGEPSEILQAISSLRSVSAIKEESSKLWAQKQELYKEASSIRLEVEDLQNKKTQIESSLKLYRELSTAGFDREAAATLTELCKNYGGVKHVIDAVSYYGNYIEIQLDVEDIEARKKDEETKLKEAEAKNKQFKTVIQLANTLIYDLGYNVDAILQLHDMAKKYGGPEEAYTALSKYGDLKSIEESNENFRKTRIELQTKNREMYLQLQGLKGQVETVKESVSGLLRPLATELTKTIDSTFQTLTSTYTKQIDIIKKESAEYAKSLAKAELLGEELNLARTVTGLLRYPTKAKNLPFRYAFHLLDGVLNLCLARNLNAKITLRDAIKPVGTIITSETEIDIFGLVDATREALKAASVYA